MAALAVGPAKESARELALTKGLDAHDRVMVFHPFTRAYQVKQALAGVVPAAAAEDESLVHGKLV